MQVSIKLYLGMLKARLIEERMILLLRQGRLKKWFSGIGQEAISVGVVSALEKDEFIFPLIRNIGIFINRDISMPKLFAQLFGKAAGFTEGRDRSFHFGSLENCVVGMISHLGPQLSVANGVALARKLKKQRKVTVAFSGDGATSEGEFHEAMNLAAVWDLPIIFVIESNQWALSTPRDEQYRCRSLVDKAIGYGMQGVQIDGNDAELVYLTIERFAEKIRKESKPVLVECLTYRVRGHEEASGVKYVPTREIEEWTKRDPLLTLEKKLISQNLITEEEVKKKRAELSAEIDKCAEETLLLPEPSSAIEKELNQVYKKYEFIEVAPSAKTKKLRLIDAIRDGLDQALSKYKDLVIMGQDVAGYGGVFKATEGFLDRYGSERIRNTPLCESAPTGAALGLSLMGIKSIVEMQYSDFVSCAFTQIVNNLAKIHYRWGANASVVIRMPSGAGIGAGPFHSQSTEAWFTHVPGLKIVYPSNPIDAKGLLLASIEDPNPVLFFEQKFLYRSTEAEVPEGYYNIEIGKGKIVSEGNQVTIVSYGLGVVKAKEILAKNPQISAELIDLRSLVPWDKDLVKQSVEKTNRVIILHEDTETAGFGAEIAAYIAENCFSSLEAPVTRCASIDTPIPFSTELENQFLPWKRFEEKLKWIVGF